jgi:hypothetical protein
MWPLLIGSRYQAARSVACYCYVSLSGEGHHTVTKTGTLRTVPVEGHGDVLPLSFHDIHYFFSS